MGKKNRRARYPSPEDTYLDTSPISRKAWGARTPQQSNLIHSLTHRDLTFTVGPAGTGKTFVTTAFACDLLKANKIRKIVVTRPMVSSEEEIGFLPGTVDEKFAPYFAPVREIMVELLGKSHVENLLRNGRIEMAPIAFLRGHTFKDAFVIFDEAQNTTPKQMQLFLSRIGEGAKVCVDGDLDQKDLLGLSGLEDAIRRFQSLPEVDVVSFSHDDIVRSGLARKITQGYQVNHK